MPASLAHTARTMRRGMSPPFLRPLQGKAVSHTRLSLPRAGSPSYSAPRLDPPPSGCEFLTADTQSPSSQPLTSKTKRGLNLSQNALFYGSCTPKNNKPFHGFSLPSPCPHVHMGENTLGIAHLSACQGKSYSGPIRLTPEITMQAVHCNNLHPSLDSRDHTTI